MHERWRKESYSNHGCQFVLGPIHVCGRLGYGHGRWPATIQNSAVVIDEYDGFTSVDDYKLDCVAVWARILGVQEGLIKKELEKKIAKRLKTLHSR